jgi:hypothetical protein
VKRSEDIVALAGHTTPPSARSTTSLPEFVRSVRNSARHMNAAVSEILTTQPHGRFPLGSPLTLRSCAWHVLFVLDCMLPRMSTKLPPAPIRSRTEVDIAAYADQIV